MFQMQREDLDKNQLDEMKTRTLTAQNPHAPHNLVYYNYMDRNFKKLDSVDQTVIHFAIDGDLILKDSEEAHMQ